MPASHGADDNPPRVTDPSGVTLDNNNTYQIILAVASTSQAGGRSPDR